jgi:hypothetical protein
VKDHVEEDEDTFDPTFGKNWCSCKQKKKKNISGGFEILTQID